MGHIKTLSIIAVVSDLTAVLMIALAVGNVFRKIKTEKMLDNAVYRAITWEHNILIPASFLLLTGTFMSIYVILNEPDDSNFVNPL